MRHVDVTLDDKFLLTEGRVFITGVQALLRVMMDQHRLDQAAGLNTAGFVSGYRGSPLGGLDQQAHRAEKFLQQAGVVFKEGLNEDLAATAVCASARVDTAALTASVGELPSPKPLRTFIWPKSRFQTSSPASE